MGECSVKFGKSANPDPAQAVAELAQQIKQDAQSTLIFFCHPKYDLDALGKAIRHHFDGAAFGCTTAGEILTSFGYMKDMLIGATISSKEFKTKLMFIPSLKEFVEDPNPAVLAPLKSADPKKSFCLFLVDGLSMLEERVVANINGHLNGIPLIGGSAGDNLSFAHSYVYHNGAFYENAAVLAHVQTDLPFKPFRIQHFEPTDAKLVITDADGPSRIVKEINGEPAAEEYARTVGKTVDQLNPSVFAANPVMLKIGGEYFVRSIANVTPEGYIKFFCAIDEGLVLTIGKPLNMTQNLQENLNKIASDVPNLRMIFGCDCILRRIELQEKQLLNEAKVILQNFPFFGFSTYGEQYGGVHVNQTLTALALGA